MKSVDNVTLFSILSTILTIIATTQEAKAFHFPPQGQGMEQQNPRKPSETGLNESIVNDLDSKGSRWALWRHGYLIHVKGNFNEKSEVKSLRKTWHSLAVGAAIKQGKIPSVNQKVSTFLTGLKGKDADASWFHVMTQSAGFDYPGCGGSSEMAPGTWWEYSDANPKNLCDALARVYGRSGYNDNYISVIKEAYFDAIGMSGYSVSTNQDGIRFTFDLEDMGRLGLLVIARGAWNGKEIIDASFIEALESKQTKGMQAHYSGCNDGDYPSLLGLDSSKFPEAPYGYMTWTNSNGDYFPGADTGWAFGAGAGGSYILWNAACGIVFAGFGVDQ
jgi:CubicO group peptidase (beta-lactamase class C family)